MLFGILVNHIGNALIEKFNFVDDPGADCWIAVKHFLKFKGILDAGNIIPGNHITAAVSNGVSGILGESFIIDFRTDIEHVAAINPFVGCQMPNFFGLAHGHLGVTVYAG